LGLRDIQVATPRANSRHGLPCPLNSLWAVIATICPPHTVAHGVSVLYYT